MGLLDGRVVLITGAGRGIGREHALLMASEGAKVVVNDLGGGVDGSGEDTGPAEQTAQEIRDMGGEAVANNDSVTDWEGSQRMINAAVEAFGDLHVLVNNAGILRDTTFHKMTEEDWDTVINVHLKGSFKRMEKVPTIQRKPIIQLERFTQGPFKKAVALAIDHRMTTIIITACIVFLAIMVLASNRLPFSFFQMPDTNLLRLNVGFVAGTSEKTVQSFLSLDVSDAADNPPPSLLIPLLLESIPPVKTLVTIWLPETFRTFKTILPSSRTNMSLEATSAARFL